MPDQSPTYATPSTTAGVAVTVSLALKNQICFRSFAVCGLSWVGHGDANGRSMRWPHIGQSQRLIGFAGERGSAAAVTPVETSAPATARHVTARLAVRPPTAPQPSSPRQLLGRVDFFVVLVGAPAVAVLVGMLLEGRPPRHVGVLAQLFERGLVVLEVAVEEVDRRLLERNRRGVVAPEERLDVSGAEEGQEVLRRLRPREAVHIGRVGQDGVGVSVQAQERSGAILEVLIGALDNADDARHRDGRLDALVACSSAL